MSEKVVWAYLLRLPVGTGAIGLEHSNQTISRDGKNYFSIRRCMVGNPEITDLCGVCTINGQRFDGVSHIEHGWKIAVPVVGKEYVFVECYLSNKVLRPLGIDGTHAVAHLLGEGGFGKVYLCFAKISTNPFALKVCKGSSDRERDILNSLNHAHVIDTIFFQTVGKLTFIGMEYMAGGDLSTFVRQGKVRLSESQTKLIFYQIADAVHYLHSKSICHRDLKPANILLHRACPRTLIKVTDLGISKSELLHSPPNTAIGTVCFMAPETLQQQYTKKVDVWSLGVMLYLSLTGSFACVVGNDVPLPELASNRNVTKLIKTMLEISHTRRANMMDIMRHEWFQDDHMKKEVSALKAEFKSRSSKADFKNGSSKPNVTPSEKGKRPSEKLKDAENDGIGLGAAIGIVIGGIVLAALAIFFR